MLFKQVDSSKSNFTVFYRRQIIIDNRILNKQ